ncbi:hypothetical protein GCM10017691_12780 [Pseudonocardia petroleophila]|uniref:Uncharacterized protein n=1 Tax=Pseudonocardia petroleophila TaxID=37331 RepID=A0A7G7MIJ4_9PSEU|nr:hypothetical protein [Pseudonocardia petroleophila]QNG52605.1 hypothetical protein H6H00_00485 [Pseudonocardia petroleophila]
MPEVPPTQGLYYTVKDSPLGPEGTVNKYAGLILIPYRDAAGDFRVGSVNTEFVKLPQQEQPLLSYLIEHGLKLWMHAPEVKARRPSLISPASILGSDTPTRQA